MMKIERIFLTVNPIKLVNYGLLDVGKINEIHQIGYDSACEVILKIDDLSRFQKKINY